jgi:hypothetical protein
MLSPQASPRYWLPNEPVVLITGSDTRPSHRHGYDGRLRPDGLMACQLLPDMSVAEIIPGQLGRLHAQLDALEARGDNPIAFRINEGRPWNPLLLEWMVELFPARPKGGADLYGRGYPADYIRRNYALGADAVDLRHRDVEFYKGANVYTGTSILTPHASVQLDQILARELARLVKPTLLGQFYQDHDIPPADRHEYTIVQRRQEFNTWAVGQTPALPPLPNDDQRSASEQVDTWLRQAADAASAWAQARSAALAQFYQDQQVDQADQGQAWLYSHFDSFLAWYLGQIEQQRRSLREVSTVRGAATLQTLQQRRLDLAALKNDSQLIILRAALVKLAVTPCLAQSLSGFNEALLMRRQTFQLPISDPLAFADAQTFVGQVRQAVGRESRSSPQPLDDFNPIRAGALNLLRLRLVDTFGQVRELAWGDVAASEPLAPLDTRYPLLLPPRVVQPLRLNFRWLAADSPDQEMNQHPATSPICGWVLANHLDSSLMIYDQAGTALGALTLDPDQPWQPAPGGAPTPLEAIASPYLRQALQSLVRRQRASLEQHEPTTFLERFLALIDSALEHIEPDYAAHHASQALLIGRPLALVRATLDLELQGPPAVHQGWSIFRQDMRRATRETHGFEQVSFPMRIGEHQQLNDGLVGYWIEGQHGFAEERFYAPQSEGPSDDYLVLRGAAPIQLYQAPAAPPQTLSMLMDPRGVVHATCGVVPTKAIDIPPDQYLPALQAIEITFLTAPLLTDRGALQLSLPNEPGYAWSWLAREGADWRERGTIGVLAKADVLAAFGARGASVWQQLLAKGWLALIDVDRASVVPNDQRTAPDLGADLRDAMPQIEALLARTRITPFQPAAAFSGPQEIREGWLKLRTAAETTAE